MAEWRKTRVEGERSFGLPMLDPAWGTLRKKRFEQEVTKRTELTSYTKVAKVAMGWMVGALALLA